MSQESLRKWISNYTWKKKKRKTCVLTDFCEDLTPRRVQISFWYPNERQASARARCLTEQELLRLELF